MTPTASGLESLRTLKIAVSVLSAFQRAQRSDHLGSSNVSYRPSDGQTTTQRYYPWGTIRPGPDNALPTDYTFTGQKLDESTGLMYYGARYYDAALGRFVQADTIVPNPANPQDLNRYAYAANSPLSFVDPNGHQVPPPESCPSDGLCYTGTFGPYTVEAASPAVQPLTTGSYQSSHDVYYYKAMPPRQVLGSEAFIQAHRPGAGGLILYGLELFNALGAVAVPAQGAGYEMIMPPGQAGVGARTSGTGSPVVPLDTALFRLSREGEFTARYFPDNLPQIRPMPVGGNYDAHHMLAQAFERHPGVAQALAEVGVSIHDPRWGAWWERGPAGTHQKKGRAYNEKWRLWLRDNPTPRLTNWSLRPNIWPENTDWIGQETSSTTIIPTPFRNNDGGKARCSST
jgi:RHS repeat-associated protein